MAIHDLPGEVLELIAEHLSVKDLLTCSAVSIQWREVFNSDLLWKKFCLRKMKDYLEYTQCQVKPSFTLPEHKEERLEPLCTWRIHYMRKTHLLNNWKSKKFFSTEIRPYSGIVSSEMMFDSEGVHWLFIRSKSEIEIWNIDKTPQFCKRFFLFLDCPNVNMLVVGKKVVVTQWNVVSVYSLENNYELLFMFLLEDCEALPLNIWDTTDQTKIKHINKEDDFRFYTFGDFFVGHKRIPNTPLDLSMHLWNINAKEKCVTKSMLNTLTDFIEITSISIFKVDEDKGLVRLLFISPSSELHSQMYVYNFKKHNFMRTNIAFEGVVAWCGCAYDIIVTFTSHPGTIKFFDFSLGKQLAERDIGIYTNSEQMQLIDSYLLYGMFNSLNVMDIRNQEIVYCLEFSFYSFVRRLTIIEPSFVVVWLLERGGSPGCPSYIQEVWNLKDLSNKLFQCNSDMGYEMINTSSSLIKQVIRYDSMIYLYTFW